MKAELAIGFFSALQTVTDVLASAPGHAQLPDKSLGTGVKFETSKPMTLQEVETARAMWNANRQCRGVLGSIKLDQTGHMICETRQWTLEGLSLAQRLHALRSMDAKFAICGHRGFCGFSDACEHRNMIRRLFHISL